MRFSKLRRTLMRLNNGCYDHSILEYFREYYFHLPGIQLTLNSFKGITFLGCEAVVDVMMRSRIYFILFDYLIGCTRQLHTQHPGYSLRRHCTVSLAS